MNELHFLFSCVAAVASLVAAFAFLMVLRNR